MNTNPLLPSAQPHRPKDRWRRSTAWLLLACLQVFPPGIAFAGPEGEQVVSGSADFHREGNLTHITTHTPETIVNYTGFDIGVHETVRIDQPGAHARILNNVLSTDPTFLDGQLVSNGQVWIVNPVGVFVGDRAIIDVGSLVAAAGHVDHEDFLAGVDRISELQGEVGVAAGAQIRAAEQVLLAGRYVANYGHIEAPGGMIALVAGDAVRLARVDGRVSITADRATAPDPDRFGVVQAGHLDAGSTGSVHLTAGDAYSLAMNHTGITRAGEIHAEGGDGGVVRIAGRLDASREGEGEQGGRIAVLGDTIGLVDATLDASGDAGGGEILVGGEQQGQGDTPTAERTYVDADSVLRADALSEGNGGRIIVWADDTTAFYGTVSGRGGAESGDGGFAEISGKRSLVSRGDVDLGADNGEFGTLLYDPLQIVIRGGTADGTDAPNVDANLLQGDAGLAGFVASTDNGTNTTPGVVVPFEIYESEIEGTQANLVLQAGQSITTTGTFNNDSGAGEGVGVVRLQPGRDLDLLVVDTGDPVLPGDIVGIDIRTSDTGDLTWQLSDGGAASLRTETDGTRASVIRVGTLETQGVRDGAANAIEIDAQGSGDIEIGTLRTSGSDPMGSPTDVVDGVVVNRIDAGNVTVLTDAGDVTVGTIEAVGGNATNLTSSDPTLTDGGDGGDGGIVSVASFLGAVTVDTIDVSGGDGVAQLLDTGSGPSENASGGFGGGISLIADADPTSAEPAAAGARSVTVTGNLLARGGDGLGTRNADVPDPDGGPPTNRDFGASGGAGGQIFLGAGLVADEGTVTVGGAGPVVVDASGGAGTSAGGNATGGGISPFSGAAVGSVRVEAHDDVVLTDTDIVANGGRSGFDTQLASVSGPGGLAGGGGEVSMLSDAGDVRVDAASTVTANGAEGRFESSLVMPDPDTLILAGQGGGGGNLVFEANGDGGQVEVLGALSARGGDGNYGAAGAGGQVLLDTQDGAATLADVDVSGGNANFVVVPGLMLEPLAGGNGGNVQVTTRAGTGSSATGGGDVLLGGTITSLGGTGIPTQDPPATDPNENHGVGGLVRITSVQDVESAGSNAQIQAGTVVVTGSDVFAAGNDLLLSSTGNTGPADFVDQATVEAAGNARVLLDDANAFDRVELIQDRADRNFDAFRSDGTTVVVDADGTSATQHTLQSMVTQNGDAHLTYRLRTDVGDGDGGTPIDAIETQTLVVANGAVNLGDNGGTLAHARAVATESEGERLIGAIEAQGAGPHVTTAGNLQLFGTRIGSTATPLSVNGTGASVELGVAGSVDASVTNAAILDVTQRVAGADVNIGLGGGDVVTIDGTVVDDGQSRTETTRVTAANTTTSGTAFYFHLDDDSAGSGPADEPTVVIANGAVQLGADGGFASRGSVQLEDGAGSAIDAGGNQLALIADTDRDGIGAVLAEGTGTHVANVGALLAVGGAGVGSEANPLRTNGGATLAVAGSGGSGDFQLVNDNGVLQLVPIDLLVANRGEQETVSYAGVGATGDVVLDNGGREIVLGAIQPDETSFQLIENPAFVIRGTEEGTELRAGFGDLRYGLAAFAVSGPAVTNAHVTSGGNQRFAGDVTLANPRSYEISVVDDMGNVTMETRTANEVRLQAGGGVTFEGDVDTDAGVFASDGASSLDVAAAGVGFAGDIGSDSGGTATIDTLGVDTVSFGAGPHSVTVAQADFRGAIGGPGALTLRGLGTDSELRFHGDVGAGQALASFDADADFLTFGAASSGITSVGDVALNMATPVATVPETATIADTGGGFVIRSGGNVSVGAQEKLSSAGALGIAAAGTVSVGDLSATSIDIDAPTIVIQGRAPGNVALPSGTRVADRGVDWVANDIVTSSRPVWDGAGAAPVFALGSGGVRFPGGPLPFETVRFTADGAAIDLENFGSGRLADLVGTGGPVISDASQDVPRPERNVQPTLQARFSDTAPVPAPVLDQRQVLNYVRCLTPEGFPCDADAIGGPSDSSGSALDTERAREIVRRYHDLIASPVGRRELAKAFAPLGLEPAPPADGAALYATLASDGRYYPARQSLEELATVLTQISLLGLDDPATHEIRRAVARDFADAAASDRLDAALVLDAVEASGVGALP